MDDDSNVEPLGAKTKPVDKLGLRLIRYTPGGCNHSGVTYVVDEKLAEVQCGECGAGLEPIWVLRQLCEKEAKWNRNREEYLAIKQEVQGRTRTRCQHCDQMTSINVKGRLSAY